MTSQALPQTTSPEFPDKPSGNPRETHVVAQRAFWCAWSVALAAFVLGELTPAWLAGTPQPGLWDWLLTARAESLVWLILLMTGPIAWWWRRRVPNRLGAEPSGRTLNLDPGDRVTGREIATSLAIGAVALGLAIAAGRSFAGLPPAYHDEFSYLFQARTFLAGRVAFDSPPLRELFDQMHVLNEGRMASRYFPATGLWLAPFVAMGHAEWGWWAAQGGFVCLVYWIGRETGGRTTALVSSLLTAVCPGLLLFSNLILAHHPTLLGLGVFLCGMLRLIRLGSFRWGLVAGCGLAFAALARPMTAASVALPWGVFLIWRAFRDRRELRLWPALATPLLTAGAMMLAYDHAITGNIWETPYGLYTRLHTPRHVYGFNNVVRGADSASERVIAQYDQWAENLTPELAVRNVRNRLLTSAQWTIGIIPLVFGAILWLMMWPRLSTGARLCGASIAMLHLAHIPYWYDGILHFHYVFESLPLWIVCLSSAGTAACSGWRSAHRTWLPRWCLAALLLSTGLNYTTEQGFWSAPYRDGVSQVLFARRKQADFQQRLDRDVIHRPALVLVEPDPADLHIDFVVNSPPLTGEILRARDLPGRYGIDEIRHAWPGRTIYRYRVKWGSAVELPPTDEPPRRHDIDRATGTP